MVTQGGTAKLLDFGVAKQIERAPDVTETTPGMLLGTPAYMSPEQIEGQQVDERSDIFSFGAVLYEIVSGRRPFAGQTTSQVISGDPARRSACARARRPRSSASWCDASRNAPGRPLSDDGRGEGGARRGLAPAGQRASRRSRSCHSPT